MPPGKYEKHKFVEPEEKFCNVTLTLYAYIHATYGNFIFLSLKGYIFKKYHTFKH